MQVRNIYRNQWVPAWYWSWIILLAVLVSCEKTGMKDTQQFAHPTADTSGDLHSVLAKSPFTLFRKAWQRIGGDSLIPAAGYFTIFAPQDAAMQAAGLDAAHIGSIPLDSLKKIILYHVTYGAYPAAALTAAVQSIECNTLRQDISSNPKAAQINLYQQNLYLRKSGALYVNGEPVSNAADTAWSASNGFIWPLQSVLQAPTQSLWQIMQTRPELSMYFSACHIDDSIYNSLQLLKSRWGNNFIMVGDSNTFSRMVYDNQPNSYSYGRARPTVFAPTNAAFAAAGFNTYQDLVTYASRTKPGPSPAGNNIYIYTAMDSVLKSHIVFNTMNKFTNFTLYADLLYNPDINNGSFNNLVFWQAGWGYNLYPATTPLLQFSNAQGTVSISWSPSQPNVLVPSDRSRHIMAQNGMIYEIDQLFYPHN